MKTSIYRGFSIVGSLDHPRAAVIEKMPWKTTPDSHPAAQHTSIGASKNHHATLTCRYQGPELRHAVTGTRSWLAKIRPRKLMLDDV